MQAEKHYKTRQRAAIVAYLSSLSGGKATAAQIARHFRDAASPISTATIYRHLEKMAAAGEVKRVAEEGGSAGYYLLDGQSCHEHLHMRCTACGKLVHFTCSHVDALRQHAMASHGLQLDPVNTVFTGKCAACSDPA